MTTNDLLLRIATRVSASTTDVETAEQQIRLILEQGAIDPAAALLKLALHTVSVEARAASLQRSQRHT